MAIPEWVRRVKIDVGLSVNAPHSQIWLDKNPDLFVFGFEPVKSNIDAISKGNSKWPVSLNCDFIGKRLWIIPCALGNESNEVSEVYVTSVDPGCSSLLVPKTLAISSTEKTTIWKLSDFLDYFPWQRFPYIEHLKIDVQGMDFEVLKGAEHYIKRIMFITIEVDTNEYEETSNNRSEISIYLLQRGFRQIPLRGPTRVLWELLHPGIEIHFTDLTFFNPTLLKQKSLETMFIYQHG